MRRGKTPTAEVINRLVNIGVQRLTEDVGMDADLARTIMRETAHTLCNEYGGNEFYMPRDLELARNKRDEEIWRLFSGGNGQELAIRFRLSERQVRCICELMRKRAVALNQLNLPGIETPD